MQAKEGQRGVCKDAVFQGPGHAERITMPAGAAIAAAAYWLVDLFV